MNKKILIIGQALNKKSGGGITLSNLLSGIDREQLALAASYGSVHSNDKNLCSNLYVLGDEEIKPNFPLSLLKNKRTSEQICEDTNQDNENKNSVNNKKKFIILIYSYLLHFFGLYFIQSDIKVSNKFLDWFDDFSPDTVYTQLSNYELIKFLIELKKRRNFRLIIHVMDDWPSIIVKMGLFKKYWDRRINNYVKFLFNECDVLLTISKKMSQEYFKRYGVKSNVFHNPIDIDFWTSNIKKDYSYKNIFTILYAGRIGKGTSSSLISIAKCVDLMSKDGFKIMLVIQTTSMNNQIKKKLKKCKSVSFKQSLEYDELPQRFSNSDLLILPMDFNKSDLEFIKYSIPTKLTEYMISGTPVLVFAPSCTALSDFAKNSGSICVVNSEDSLYGSIKELYLDEELRKKMGLVSSDFAKRYFDSSIITQNFRNKL